MKKLIVKEFELMSGEKIQKPKVGYKWTYFFDPETGKYYRPISSFEVTGEDLSTMFVEIDSVKHEKTSEKRLLDGIAAILSMLSALVLVGMAWSGNILDIQTKTYASTMCIYAILVVYLYRLYDLKRI